MAFSRCGRTARDASDRRACRSCFAGGLLTSPHAVHLSDDSHHGRRWSVDRQRQEAQRSRHVGAHHHDPDGRPYVLGLSRWRTRHWVCFAGLSGKSVRRGEPPARGCTS